MRSPKLSEIAAKQLYASVIREARHRHQLAQEKRRKAQSYQVFREKYWEDPVGFVEDCFVWQLDLYPVKYQIESLAKFTTEKRIAVRGPHGLGKTALAAWVILWFSLTRDTNDWKIPTTASSWRQLTKFLWPEVHKWIRLLDWTKIGRPKFSTYYEQHKLSLDLDTGSAFALASDNAELIEGAHADHLLYLFDESKAIPDPTWDSAEGAFADGDPFWFCISTPGRQEGRFYQIHAKTPGYEDWHTVHVTLAQAVEAGRVSQSWADQRAKQWGEESTIYKNRVLGEFADGESSGVISLALVEESNEEWTKWNENARMKGATEIRIISADIAREGLDKTVLATFGRLDDGRTVVMKFDPYTKQNLMQTTGRIVGLIKKHAVFDKDGEMIWQPKVIVDVIGMGAGVVDRLRELGYKVIAFNASEKTSMLDKSRELGFVSKRAAGWWAMKDMLEDGELLLPPDPQLTGELLAPTWSVSSGGRILVEGKDTIRKRIGRSTDYADTIIQVAYRDPTPTGVV